MMAYAAKYFKQEVEGNVRSDVDLVIRLPQAPEDAAPVAKRRRPASSSRTAERYVAADPLQLAKFPAHNMILDTSEYFKVQQAASWQQQMPCSSSAAGSSNTRPVVHLTIISAQQLPAAEGVIAAMYGVPGAISSLEQQQLVHAVVIADMLGAESATQQGVQALKAAQSEHGLAAAALQVLADLPMWPDCLLQLVPAVVSHAPCCKVGTAADLAAIVAADPGGRVQRLLVAALGDLQSVWAAADLQELLLHLPLPAMQLLLSSDQLRVPSEDTVLYTAKRYVQAQQQAAGKAAAKAGLAPLIRAPQLSQLALSCAALPADSAQQLLGGYAQQLRSLLMLTQRASAEELTTELAKLESVPASWRLGPRQLLPLADGMRLVWRLPVEQLKQACRDSFAQQRGRFLLSPMSAPMGGLAWQLVFFCRQVSGSTWLQLFVGPVDPPVGSYIKFRGQVIWQDQQSTISSLSSAAPGWRWSFKDKLVKSFELPCLPEADWDEAVWAAAGLPTTGDMLLQLHMHSVQ